MDGMGKFLKKHGATLLSILAGCGVVATGISAYKDGKNARDKEDCSGDPLQEQKRTVSVKTLSLGAGTIGAIATSRYLGYRKETELLAALGVLSAYVGKGQKRQSNQMVPVAELEDTGTGELIFTEDFTGRRFKASKEFVENAIIEYQRMFNENSFADLNDFYELLNLPKTCAGGILGWSVNQSIINPFLDENDYNFIKEAITDLGIFIDYYEGVGYVLHYPILPVAGLAGIGPCGY